MSGTALGENKMVIPKREESYNGIYYFYLPFLFLSIKANPFKDIPILFQTENLFHDFGQPDFRADCPCARQCHVNLINGI